MSLLTTYAGLTDGLRSHYASREGNDASASLSAAGLLSTLLLANISGTVLLTNELLHNGAMTLAPWVRANRAAIVLFSVLIFTLHWLFARHSGFHERRGSRSPHWARTFRLYLCSTICIFLLPVLVAILRRHFAT
jgi:hypothetical protein